MAGQRDVAEFIDEIKLAGWRVEITGGGHRKATQPGCVAVYFSSTPGDRRMVKNARAKIRRAERERRK